VLEQATHEKVSILVIDDEPAVGDALKIVLESSGYDVVLKATGRDGIKEALSKWFTVVIIDLFLPDISGLHIIKKINEQKPETLIILISSAGTPWAFSEAQKLGAVGMLSKPFSPTDILQLIAKVLAP
jgi:DNA-binding NtrC family response regulator